MIQTDLSIARGEKSLIVINSLKPTHGLQEMPMNKSFKYNSMQPLVHRECHQLPKPHMGHRMSFK